jgi:pSer/pThr/pTyr-binding forkhead associated (FHA) protein
MSANVKGESFEIQQGELTIGRSSDNDIIVDNPSVSGHHCSLIRSGDRYTIKDNGSTNGTRVNSKETMEATLKPKDLVQVGSVEFIFDAEYAETDEAESTSNTEVEVEAGPVEAPESFENISPFGTRNKQKKGIWTVLVAVMAVLAVLVVALFFIKLMGTN